MALSRKHFERFAKIFRNLKPAKDEDFSKIDLWEDIIDQFILFAQEENPRFSVDKFFKACDY